MSFRACSRIRVYRQTQFRERSTRFDGGLSTSVLTSADYGLVSGKDSGKSPMEQGNRARVRLDQLEADSLGSSGLVRYPQLHGKAEGPSTIADGKTSCEGDHDRQARPPVAYCHLRFTLSNTTASAASLDETLILASPALSPRSQHVCVCYGRCSGDEGDTTPSSLHNGVRVYYLQEV